jgi:hypothetical protein
MLTVEFPDGSRVSADSPAALLNKWHGKRWNRGTGKGEFRQIVARRAIVWSGDAIVNPEAQAADLIEQCEQAGLLRIVEES